ncbi:MAG: AI-2E family transporter [Bacteroidota bacterium]|nr:AI-2E family transporter [Bacteroidota bacterium]
MQRPRRDQLKRFNDIALAIVLVFGIMYLAGEFLKPLVFAVLMATLMAPFCRWLERKGVARGLAATLSATSVLLVMALVLVFIAYQVSSFKDEVPQLKEKMMTHLGMGQNYLRSNFGVTIEDAPEVDSTAVDSAQVGTPIATGKEKKKTAPKAGKNSKKEPAETEQEQDGKGTAIPMAAALSYLLTFLKAGFGTLFTVMIIFAYIVLLLYYRHRLRDAIVMIFPEERKERTKHALREAGTVGQGYLGGMFIVTTLLGTLNSIALLAIGIDHPFLFGYLAGYLNFIPFIGTLMGGVLPMMMAFLTENTIVPALLIAAAFTFNQVLEETFLTPKIVGDKVNVNPLFIIIAIVIGNMVWGIVGVILFIPLIAIAKIIFDHVEELRPLSHFLGQQEDHGPSLFRKLKDKVAGKSG